MTLIFIPLSAHAADSTPASADPGQTNSVAAKTFPNPDDAAKALLEAVTSDDKDQLISLFGSSEADLISSGDDVEDKKNRLEFANLAKEKMLVEPVDETKSILHVGNADWSFPIPIVKLGEAWQFDAEQGREEILNRRIGRNELNTVAAMRGYVEAQFEYAGSDWDGNSVSEYAQKLMSEPGKFDGLFWEAEEGQPQSPLGPLIAEARAQGYKQKGQNEKNAPYHGYYYRILTRQGRNAPGGKYDYIINGNMIAGFGLIAFPAQYASSGIMTFMVNHQGKTYQKDLGPKTEKVVAKIKEYDPDSTWELFPGSE
ncbi:DUF2950 domain-containing protein [Methylomonas sp. MgM2]